MTREEAIKELKEYEDGLDLEYATPFDKAILYAIKALEQEPIIDRIRAEIEQLPTSKCTETYRRYINADDFKENVLVIIDKYKAESEG